MSAINDANLISYSLIFLKMQAATTQTATTQTATTQPKRVMICDATGGTFTLRWITLDNRSSLNTNLAEALWQRPDIHMYEDCTCSDMKGASIRSDKYSVAEVYEYLTGELTSGECDNEFDSNPLALTSPCSFDYLISLVDKPAQAQKHCYCGAELSPFGGNECSEGCDYSGTSKDEDDVGLAMDSGCECGHHKRLKRLKKRKNIVG